MAVIHLENNDVTRAALARLLKVTQGQLDGHEYLETAIASEAEERLRAGQVDVLILDVGLNIEDDNKSMPALLRRLVQLHHHQHPDPQGEKESDAYRLAHLAARLKVPCALLTNWPDYLRGEKGVTPDQLKKAFHTEEVFAKDEAGHEACANWVRQQLRSSRDRRG